MDLSPLTQALVGAAASAVTLLAGGLLAMLPRLWTYAAVRINGADATLLRHAIENAAEEALRAVREGQPHERAIAGMVGYVQANLPRAIARLKVPVETIETMCAAALARLVAGRG
jgi:hypothetical protein